MPEIRPIDANALKKELCNDCKVMSPDMFECTGSCITLRIVDEMPTLDVSKMLDKESLKHEGTELQQTKADNVNAPAHYTDSKFECIDEMVLLFGVEQVKAFCRCNAWKYRHRANLKNGAEDIAKADKYLEFLNNLIEFGNPHGGDQK